MLRYRSSESTEAIMGISAPRSPKRNESRASGIPHTIIRSTQFLEFLGAIADSSADGNLVRLPPGLFQPIAADDVAAIVAEVALAAPRNGIVEIAGPERAPFNEIVARYLKAVGDPRQVVRDPEARYWGGRVEERSLVPLGEARLGHIGLDEWLRRARARNKRTLLREAEEDVDRAKATGEVPLDSVFVIEKAMRHFFIRAEMGKNAGRTANEVDQDYRQACCAGSTVSACAAKCDETRGRSEQSCTVQG
jgi:hypothetical protein